MTNLILAFRSFVNVPKNVRNNKVNVTFVKLVEVCWSLQVEAAAYHSYAVLFPIQT